MQQSFYRVVQSAADESGKEMTPKLVVSCFESEYFLNGAAHAGRIELRSIQLFSISSAGKVESPISETSSDASSDAETPSVRVEAEITVDGEERKIAGESTSALLAFAEGIRSTLLLDAEVKLQSHHDIPETNQSAAYLEMHPREGSGKPTWGVGLSDDKTSAKLHAYVSGLNALVASSEHEFPRKRAFRPILPSRRSYINRPATPPVDIPMRTGSVGPTSERQWRRSDVAGVSTAEA
jgi:2-isopropylmalate synthase